MLHPECEKINKENIELKNKIVELEKKILSFEHHPSIATGVRGEDFIAKLIGADKSKNNAPYDLVTKNGKLIEVKFASLLYMKKNNKKTKRWSWKNILGNSSNKKYDQIILMGELDERYKSFYRDKNSLYILFDIPYKKILNLTTGTEHGQRMIQLTTNPNAVRSERNKEIFNNYQITEDELKQKYRVK